MRTSVIVLCALAALSLVPAAFADNRTYLIENAFRQIQLQEGDSIHIINDDQRMHSIVGQKPNGDSFITQIMPGQSYDILFDQNGTWSYYDGFFPSHTATVTVGTVQALSTGTVQLQQPTKSNTTSVQNATTVQNATSAQTNGTVPTPNNNTPLQISPTSIGLPATTPWQNSTRTDTATKTAPQTVSNSTGIMNELSKIEQQNQQLESEVNSLKSQLDTENNMTLAIFGIVNQIATLLHI